MAMHAYKYNILKTKDKTIIVPDDIKTQIHMKKDVSARAAITVSCSLLLCALAIGIPTYKGANELQKKEQKLKTEPLSQDEKNRAADILHNDEKQRYIKDTKQKIARHSQEHSNPETLGPFSIPALSIPGFEPRTLSMEEIEDKAYARRKESVSFHRSNIVENTFFASGAGTLSAIFAGRAFYRRRQAHNLERLNEHYESVEKTSENHTSVVTNIYCKPGIYGPDFVVN
jgi:hypothetical protein